MNETVTFFVLRRKFIDQDDTPAQSQQLVYYSLAIGHHLGIIDCFEPEFSCPYPDYMRWINAITDPIAHAKLAGVPRYGEIIIDSTHVVMLAKALAAMPDDCEAQFITWRDHLMALLAMIQDEQAVHLIVRRLNDGTL